MNKSLLKKFISLVLSLVLVFSVTTTGMAATSLDDEKDGMHEMLVSTSGGSGGVYTHDINTDETEFIPVSEYEFTDAPEIIPGIEEEDDLPVEPTMDPRFVNNFKKITSPTNQYASTCLLGVRFVKSGMEDYITYGTGWLINNRYVMTAGHLLYTKDYGYANHVAVYVGASGGSYKQYRLGHKLAVGGDYVKNPGYADEEKLSPDYTSKGVYDDWGIVKLDSALTVNVVPLGRRVVNNYDSMVNTTYYINGYPKDYQTSSRWNDNVMYENSGRIEGDLSMRYVPCVYTYMEVIPGMSGGPVYRKSGTNYYAEGIAVASSAYSYGVIVLYSNFINNYISENCT